MCGIAGILRFDGTHIASHTLEHMQQELAHRGPDGRGIWQSHGEGWSVGLAHTRLAILDLSEAAAQPMATSDDKVCLAYNGEIYNYVELRAELASLGHVFNGRGDTEVLLAAYCQWGEACLGHLVGMFAFALWDDERQALFCARDRLGIKPFYFYSQHETFAFASEAKALLGLDGVSSKPDESQVYDYLSLGLMHHDRRSFFADIHQLPAGCYMWVDAAGIHEQRYWTLPTGKGREPLNLEALGALLDDAVRLRLRSDVPVGVLLSGGLDSSAITALAASHHPRDLHAFSLQFDDAASDESAHARLTATHCGIDLRLLAPQGEGLWQELDTLIRAQDAPTHAPEVYSNWCMMRAVSRQGIKVLLSGQGGDELFGGYNWYPKHLLVSLLRHTDILGLIRELLALPAHFPGINTRSRMFLLASMLQAMLPVSVKAKMKPELRGLDMIMQHKWQQRMRVRDRANLRLLDPPSLERKTRHDLFAVNIPHYLHYEDANAMAFGIEERVPMLDHRLVEWSQRLAVQWKIRQGWSKYPLRQVMHELLPPDVVNRRDKMGLSAPREQWLKHDLRHQLQAMFDEDCHIYEHWVSRDAFRYQLGEYFSGNQSGLDRLMWRLINVEKWLRLYH